MQSGTGTYYDDLHHTADDRKSRQCGYDRGKTRGRLGGNEFSSRQNEYDQYNNQSTGHESNYCCSKNGTKAEWKSFRKVDATYESKGGVTAYLNLSLDGKTRELYINEVIPTLGNNRPEKGIAVSEDEWNILRLTNIERAKEGKKLLTMPAALQKQPQSVPRKMSTIHSQHIPDQMEPATRLPFRLPLRIPDSARICTNVQKLLRHSLRCVDG